MSKFRQAYPHVVVQSSAMFVIIKLIQKDSPETEGTFDVSVDS